MNPERLRQIEELYHSVRERPAEARAALLEKADPELRREVESLLERDGIAGLMDRPPVERLRAGAKTTLLEAGTHLGPYSIEGLLGEGGMGSVYRALDKRLHRHVAIKVSNERFSDRFEREARAAAALNHPHICTLHDVGPDYLVMELVLGQTLEDLLERRLKLPETLKYAIEIADAVSAAHAADIVHRDLKPANVMITDSGSVKVLDFGLAKLTDRPEAAQDDNTRTERSLTGEGTVMGSAAYMSPEQAEGRKVDARSDIFSFGLVLYEMLSGKRAFRAASRMATIVAILHEDPPPLGKTVPGLPKELERIVTRCLRKDVARRSQSMAEIKIALEELKEEMESGASVGVVAPVKKPARRWRWWALGGVVAALGAALLFLLPGETRAPLTEVPLTAYNGFLADPALSPDGSQFAFAWDHGEDNALPQLYISMVGRGTPLQLTNTPGAAARAPAWSPDGRMIAYLRVIPGKSRSDLMVMPALGEPKQRIGGARFS